MHRILIIEKSDTRRHVLHKLLAHHGYDIAVTRDFEVAHQRISALDDSPVKYDGIIFGWPEYTDHTADDFLTLLIEPRFAGLPTLILADRYDASKRDWVTRRAHTAMLSWEDYADVLESLSTLISPAPFKLPTPSPHDELLTGEIRVLFVDDSPTIRVSYRRMLNTHGYITDTANCVAEALDKLKIHTYDLVITDYFMPNGNGDELCRKIRNNPATAHIAVGILTGTYLDRVIKDSLDAGAAECMFKNEAEELFLARVAAMSRTVQFQNSIDRERRRLEGILCSVGEGVYGVDSSGVITFINPMAKKILGWSAHEVLVGKSAYLSFHSAQKDGRPLPQEQCLLQQAYINGSEIHNHETTFWHASGSSVIVECSVVPLKTNNTRQGSVIAFSDISQRKKLESELVWQANHDSLTKLHNRHFFEKHLSAEVQQLNRSNMLSALMYVDLDRFKYINDTAGHTAGDRLLIEVSRLLQTRVRESDLLARVGGDEFSIILRNIDDEALAAVCNAIHELLRSNPFMYNGKSYPLNCSIGVAYIDGNTLSPEDALANADLACNIAKRHGRDQTHIYLPHSDEKIAMGLELGWSVRLREALQKNMFVAHYQPIVALADISMDNLPEEDGTLWEHILRDLPNMQHHYEVLIRLRSADGEIIHPSAFLPTAERFNMMREVDRWMVTHALKELKRAATYRHDTVFAINLSGVSVGDETLLPLIKNLITEHRINPRAVIFEVTETAAISGLDEARLFIRELSALGCRFALDDFGSGFSSFAQLKHLNVDFIKIDGQLIQGIANNTVDRSIVASINDIAHALGKHTVAEYVQDVHVLRVLKDCGVDFVQGYYISRPCEQLGEIETEYSQNVLRLARPRS